MGDSSISWSVSLTTLKSLSTGMSELLRFAQYFSIILMRFLFYYFYDTVSLCFRLRVIDVYRNRSTFKHECLQHHVGNSQITFAASLLLHQLQFFLPLRTGAFSLQRSMLHSKSVFRV